MAKKLLPKILVIVGPTGIGKSALGMRLARDFDGEIIGADSRQGYRLMSIGTAKPSDADRAEIPHHLVDIIDPDERYSLALFIRDAKQAIHNTKTKRSRLPIVVGGTGQYIWGLLESWRIPQVKPNAKMRDSLEQRLEMEGLPTLYEELQRLDAAAAARIDRRNPRRVVRALEVALSSTASTTTASTNEQQRATEDDADRSRKNPPDFDAMVIGVTMERAALYDRIDSRIDAQMADGWLEEVRQLRDNGYGMQHSAMSGLGYAELIRHLDGELTLDEAVQRIKYRTHNYARKQYNWFRLTDDRIRWLDAPVGDAEYARLADDVRAWLEN
ncbi:MAG: tRNA (adenosine(37)-N6)-dimethylallyltransferase MiaA [Chloroflexi bacterium]|nr:tRNA (adenosine(37)-N6)-dimethylallyltransferase MiaA [Chloroflexota bacterium]